MENPNFVCLCNWINQSEDNPDPHTSKYTSDIFIANTAVVCILKLATRDPANVIVITRRQLQASNMAEIAALRREVHGMATSITSYDGSEDFETWLFDFESLAAHQGLEEEIAKARLLSFNLTGEAKKHFHALKPEQKRNCEEIKICLRNAFKLTKGAKQKLKLNFIKGSSSRMKW